jgi:hypothetical protein
MGGPGVEWTSAGVECPQLPNPSPHAAEETLASTGSQGLLLCTEQAEGCSFDVISKKSNFPRL